MTKKELLKEIKELRKNTMKEENTNLYNDFIKQLTKELRNNSYYDNYNIFSLPNNALKEQTYYFYEAYKIAYNKIYK